MMKNILIVFGAAVFALVVVAASLCVRSSFDSRPPATTSTDPPGASEPPRADATVRVVLPTTPEQCAQGGAVAVVRARVYAPGSNIDREMDVMLLPGSWAAP